MSPVAHKPEVLHQAPGDHAPVEDEVLGAAADLPSRGAIIKTEHASAALIATRRNKINDRL